MGKQEPVKVQQREVHSSALRKTQSPAAVHHENEQIGRSLEALQKNIQRSEERDEESTLFSCGKDSQQCTGLPNDKCYLQAEVCDPSLLLSIGEATTGVLCPLLDSPIQDIGEYIWRASRQELRR